METIELFNQKTSKKRIVGAAFFGLILGGYLESALSYTVPTILSIVQKIDVEIAQENYDSSFVIKLLLRVIISFAAALVATFIARKGKIIVGLLANSLFIIIVLIILGFAIMYNDNEIIWKSILFLFLITISSILGTMFGNKLYSSEMDLDSLNDKVTIFGIRWFNYFWILPFIIYPFLSSFIIVTYAGILALLADFYHIIHPSLWLNLTWWLYFFIVPILVYIAIIIIIGGFVRFFGIMQYSQTKSHGWKKFKQVLIYGIGAPILSYFIAVVCANITHKMPRPISGDWKLGLILIFIIPLISILISVFSWIKEKIIKRSE